ncbi:acyltransferase family protein [Citrobacter freundii]|uniref:acyltransferase family protein n=1 Tax=Citrobacter freundii TaxID=546 RepID=UPI0002B8A9FA|nr:acyltransferase family protein [Citrobacter freundii]EMF20589.1 O-actetyl transferase related protein [Citrobacter freundii GTC 09479]
MYSQEQKTTIDYVKALGIIAVVIGHYYWRPFGSPDPYLFHMPLFFFLGGLVMNTTKSPKKFFADIFKRHIAYIFITYLIIGIAVSLISKFSPIDKGEPFSDGLLLTISNIYHYCFHNNKFFLVAWFLAAYACSSVAMFVVAILTSKMKKYRVVIFSISLMSGFIGISYAPTWYYSSGNIAYNYLSQILTGFMFMGIGLSVKEIIFKSINIYGFLICYLAVSFLTLSGKAESITMSWSKYPSGFIITTISCLMCIYLLFCFCNFLSESIGKSSFTQVGISSKTIMSYHLLVMYGLDWVFSKMGMVDLKGIGVLSHHYNYSVWPFYIITPIVTLTAANILYRKLKSLIK